MVFDADWSSQDLAKNLCDDLIANKLLKEKPAFIRTDRETLLAGLFVEMSLDGAKMASFKNPGPLETLVRNGTQGQAWVDSVVGGLKAMLPDDVAAATITIGMSEEAKEELAAAKEKTMKMRERQGDKGGGRGRDEDDAYGSFGGRSGGGGGGYKGGGGGGDSGECYNCGGFGHMSRDCNEPRKGKGKGGDRGGGRSGGGDQECFNCGEVGHLSRECDAPRKGKGGGGGGGKGGGDQACFNCGETGHLSRDCSEPRKPKGGGRDRDY